MAAPADTGGKNAAVPAPLRKCWYCPQHFRGWLVQAHQDLPTNVIFAHISSKARPIMGAEMGKRGRAEPDAEAAARAAPKAPKMSKRMKRLLSKKGGASGHAKNRS